MEGPKQILCSSCHEPIWVMRQMVDGKPAFFPAQPESPTYQPNIRQCPYCGLSIYMGRRRTLQRDERSGRLLVA